MSDSETMRKGTEMRRKLLGDAWVERANKNNYNDPVMKEFIEVATESVFGTLWTRPGLDLKTRTLVCVISAPEGVAFLQRTHPDVDIYTPVVDRELNAHKFIVPGLGDFGDRLYGT